MIFSLGNLISIVIVIVILIVYRALDRSNRSLEKVKRFADKIRDGLAALVEEKTTEMKNLSIEVGVNLKTGKEVLKRVREVEENLAQKASGIDEIRHRLEGYDQAMGELVGMTARVDENLKRIQSESLFVDKVGKRIAEASARLSKIEQEGSQLSARLAEENRKGLEALRAELTSTTAGEIQALAATVAESEKRIKDFSTYVTRLEARGAELEQERLQSLRKGFEELELEAKARRSALLNQVVASLNKLLTEADAKGKQFRAQLAEAANAAGEKLAGGGEWLAEMDRLKAEASRRLEESTEQMQVAALKRIEQSLEGYEREVEYRFQKLEAAGGDIEALEANLREAVERTGARIRQEFELHAQKLTEERNAERERAQADFAALRSGVMELEAGLTELKSKAYENVSAQLQVFEDEFFRDIRGRSVAMEEKLAAFQEELESRLREITAGAAAERAALERRYGEELASELERSKLAASEELKRLASRGAEFEAAVTERVGAAESRIVELAGNLPAQIDAIRQEAQASYRRELAAFEEALESDLGRTRREMEAVVSGLRSEFAAQRDDLIASTAEERAELKEEFKAIQERIAQLESDLGSRSERALDKFRTDWESFQAEFSRRTKEAQSEMENRTRELKSRLAEMREKSEALQLSLFGKIEEGYKTLSVSLADMDKRVKAFSAQTKLFERSDELKILLENKIEEMKRDLEKLTAQRKEVEDMEARLAVARRSVEELGGKLGKLLAERGKVDDMDMEFKKLLSLSKNLDQRLDTVTTSHDALQEIQAKIRELEQLEKSTEGRFERLEKKKAILETTITGVDKSFQQLTDLEKSLETFRIDTSSLTAALTELKQQAEILAANKEKSDSVVRKMGDLDATLADLEGRMAKLEKAREWLAKTETRFEHIGKQAQEQVRLLESILKAERQNKGEEEAPALDRRDTVIKLARLGWSPQEIARTTRLSRGEVELILELAPKK